MGQDEVRVRARVGVRVGVKVMETAWDGPSHSPLNKVAKGRALGFVIFDSFLRVELGLRLELGLGYE